MPPISYLAVEMVAFLFAGLVAVEAWKLGPAKFTTFLVGVGFGFAIEMFFVTQYAGYSYGKFLVSFPLAGHTVPLWVAAGWGTIIFISMAATDRMGLPWYVAPAADGMLAVSLDATLDPIADAQGWWHWSREAQFFGVPYDNFIGWVLIVSSISLFTRLGFELLHKHGLWKDIVVPIVALVPAVALVAGAQVGLDKVLYPHLGEPITFGLLAIGLLVYVLPWALEKKPVPAPPWYLWAVPAAYHGLMLVILATSELVWDTPELIMLMVFVPVASLYMYLHPFGASHADAQA